MLKFLLSSFVCICVIALFVCPVLAQDRELVGVTSETTSGFGGGVAGMHERCKAEFPGTRMCSSSDIVRNGVSDALGLPLNNLAWVHPSREVPDTRFISTGILDAVSGIPTTAGSTLSCGSWNNESSNNRGLIIGDDGTLSLLPCSATIAVACCALVAAPSATNGNHGGNQQ